MASKGQSVQAVFLDHVRDHHVPVSIFLINGVKLQGVVVGHDAFTVQLIFRGHAQSIYKRAISTCPAPSLREACRCSPSPGSRDATCSGFVVLSQRSKSAGVST